MSSGQREAHKLREKRRGKKLSARLWGHWEAHAAVPLRLENHRLAALHTAPPLPLANHHRGVAGGMSLIWVPPNKINKKKSRNPYTTTEPSYGEFISTRSVQKADRSATKTKENSTMVLVPFSVFLVMRFSFLYSPTLLEFSFFSVLFCLFMFFFFFDSTSFLPSTN